MSLHLMNSQETVQESKRVRTTVHGSRGSFLSDAEEHGVGARHISRRFRHTNIVEEAAQEAADEEEDEHQEEGADEAPSSPGSSVSDDLLQSRRRSTVPSGPKPASDALSPRSKQPQTKG